MNWIFLGAFAAIAAALWLWIKRVLPAHRPEPRLLLARAPYPARRIQAALRPSAEPLAASASRAPPDILFSPIVETGLSEKIRAK